MANIRLHILVFLSFASLFIPRFHGLLEPSQKHAALFVFGDSNFDAGNNNYLNSTFDFPAKYWPYGMTFFKHSTGRFSDGRLVSDFIAEYANLPWTRPYLEPGFSDYSVGVNFASAGAGALVETNQGFTIDIKTQLKYFEEVKMQLGKKLGKNEATKLLSRSVYLISLGGNDYLSAFLRNSTVLQSYSHKEYVGMVIGNVTSAIKQIYADGGRKFGFQNFESMGCYPLIKAVISGDNCLREINTLSELHNEAFSAALQKLESELEGFKYSIFDSRTFFSERMNFPSNYGFKDGKTACCGSGPYRGIPSCAGRGTIKEYELCGNPSEYVFFDYVHTTERANEQIAKLMWDGPCSFSAPFNLKALFKME